MLYGSDHIVRRQRPPDPLQLELTYRLDLHRVLDLHQHARTDEDLPWLCSSQGREATLETVPMAAGELPAQGAQASAREGGSRGRDQQSFGQWFILIGELIDDALTVGNS